MATPACLPAICPCFFGRSAARTAFLTRVGLGYLALSRPLSTLSGGEAQRVNLTSALGSSLVNMLYVLDEPSVGLHPGDVDKLVAAVQGLKDRGNTVAVVELKEVAEAVTPLPVA